MSSNNDDLNNGGWYERYKKKQDALRKKMEKLDISVRKLAARLRRIHAEMLLEDLEKHPEKQKEFIDKLYSPFYTPTVVEEMVIQKLFEKENDGKSL